MRLPFLLALLCGPASAAGYDDHRGVLLFTEAPCTAVLEAIDATPPDWPSDTQQFFYGTAPYWDEMGRIFAAQGMTWGFILGYDTAMGGLHADGETTLERLRLACEAAPDETAKSILDGFLSAATPGQPDPTPHGSAEPDPVRQAPRP